MDWDRDYADYLDEHGIKKIQELENSNRAQYPFTPKIRDLVSHFNIVETQRF